ncbi:ISAzo13-like element transposase-related protein, partial [Mycobacterium kansasii]
TVRAELDDGEYPKGIKIPDKQIKALEAQGTLARHAFHDEWNYTLNPEPRHARDPLS